MTRTRMLLTTLVLAMALGACDTSTGPSAAAQGTDPLEALLGGTSARATQGDSSEAGSGLFDRLAAEIPGFAGLYRAGHCSVVVKLTAAADVQRALRIVRAALEPLVGERCPGLRVHAERAQWTYHELQRFLSAVQPLQDIRGVRQVKLDYKLNRIVFFVAERAVARAVLDALPRVGVPRGAVTFVVTGGTRTTSTTGSR